MGLKSLPSSILAGVVVLAIAACGAAPQPTSPGSIADGSSTAQAASASARTAAVPASPLPAPSADQTVDPSAPPTNLADAGRILFGRHNPTTDDGFCYSINPDGTHETPWAWCGPQSPDGTKILSIFARPNGFGPFLDGRPLTVSVDGTGVKVLDAYPGRKISVFCSAWSPDGRRFLCESGADLTPADDGIYTMRASDGGDLRRLTTAPAKHEDQPWGYSPDGKRILFLRLSDDDIGAVFTMNLDGSDLVRLSPPDLSASDFNLPAAWSPDGSQIAFSASRTTTGLRSVFVVNAGGSGLKEISPADVGGVDVQWSPDGRWIAFNSRICCGPQVWIVRPDGSDPKQLTAGADSSTSLLPIWSPDGSKLLFYRDKGGHQTLWTMASDGTGQTQIADAGDGFDLGGYWWSVPR